MFFPKLAVPTQNRVTVSRFLGYDRRNGGELGCFEKMENLTSDGFPALTVRKKRALLTTLNRPNGLTSKDCLIWVDGSTLYINGESTELVLQNNEKQLIGMGAYLLIWPDKLYINTCDLSDWGSLENRVETSGSTVMWLCRSDGTMWQDYVTGTEAPEEAGLWLDTSVTPYVLKQADDNGWVAVDDVCVMISATGIGTGFSAGDGVTISGCDDDEMNGSFVLLSADTDYLVVQGMVEGVITQTTPICVKRSVPEMDFVVECGNRLWGCKYGIVDGRAVNEIYASKLGDFKNWNCFAGLSTDSYVASRGSDGPFTGAAACLGSVLFFKENCMERVYPDAAGAHQIVTMACSGVQKGSHRSLAVVDGTLFYHGMGGICAFDGSLPVTVSQPLGDVRYGNAVAGCFEGKYYAALQSEDGNRHLFVYDTRRKLWHREDELQVKYFTQCDGQLYALAADGRLWAMQGDGQEKEAAVSWMAETGELGLNTPENHYLERLQLCLRPEEGADVCAGISYDEGATWQTQGQMVGQQGRVRECLLHIRPKRCSHFRLRLQGTGGCTLYSVSSVYEKGSDGP